MVDLLQERRASHQTRQDAHEIVINEGGAYVDVPRVEGQAFYPGGDAPKKEYTGTAMERTTEALGDLAQTAGSMTVGTAAGVAGLPGDVASLIGGLSSLLFPGDQGRIEAATETMTKISDSIGSERFLGMYRDFINNQADLSQEDKKMMLDAAEVGSFMSIPGAGGAVAAGKDVIKEGVVKAGQAADARIAERAADTGVTLTAGADPMPAVDAAISAAGRAARRDPNDSAGDAMAQAQARYFETGNYEPPTAENPVSIVKPTEDKPGIIAFHGSGADFDEFRVEMIGTGEGNQAYGYGLYFTDSEDIAKFYKEAMEEPKYLELEGKPLDSVYTADNEEKFADYVNRNFDPEEHDDVYVVLDNLGQGLFSLDDADALSQSSFRQGAQKQIYQKIKKDLVEPEVSEGKMYKVGLAPKPDELLDYDLPLSQQSKAVKEKAINVLKQIYPNVDNPGLTMRGSDLIGQIETSIRVKTQEQLDNIDIKLKELQKIMDADTPPGVTNIGTIRQFVSKKGEDAAKEYDSLVEQSKRLPIANFDKAASELLAQAGIPGIKYRAAGSRGAATADEAAERNYVIFDDKAVKILEKYGIVGPVAVTAASVSQTNTEAADGQDT